MAGDLSSSLSLSLSRSLVRYLSLCLTVCSPFFFFFVWYPSSVYCLLICLLFCSICARLLLLPCVCESFYCWQTHTHTHTRTYYICTNNTAFNLEPRFHGVPMARSPSLTDHLDWKDVSLIDRSHSMCPLFRFLNHPNLWHWPPAEQRWQSRNWLIWLGSGCLWSHNILHLPPLSLIPTAPPLFPPQSSYNGPQRHVRCLAWSAVDTLTDGLNVHRLWLKITHRIFEEGRR